MKRKIYNKILQWKKQWNGQTAFLVDGARRIGKSWIVEEFGRNEYNNYTFTDGNQLECVDTFGMKPLKKICNCSKKY